MNESTSRTNVSRRTIAKGAAWAVPAIAVASAAPAYAASRPTVVAASVCSLFYGSGTVNYQTHTINLGVTSSTGVIPAGTTLTWTVSMSGSDNEVPTTNYSQNNIWTLSLSQASGAVATSFTATLTFNQDYTLPDGANSTWCAPGLVWTNIYSIRPATTVSVSTSGTVGDSGSLNPGQLTYDVAKRYDSSSSNPIPHIYTTKSGSQACWPSIQYSRVLSANGRDNVTTYPTDVIPPGSRCTWADYRCNSSATGQSSPAYVAGPFADQFVQPAVC